MSPLKTLVSESPARDWLDSEGRFLFGKYKDAYVSDIALEDPHYLNWILETVDNISDEDRQVIEIELSHCR